jgi:hypothetical protein
VSFDTTPLVPGSLRLRLTFDPELLAVARVRLSGQSSGLAAPEGEHAEQIGKWGISGYPISASGDVEMDGVPPGSCTLTLFLGETSNGLFGQGPFLELPRAIAIQPGAITSETIDVPHKRLRVRMLSPDGVPLAATPCETSPPECFWWKLQATTDADGWLVIDPASLLPVVIKVPGVGVTPPVVVPEGQTEAEVEVRLERKDG